MLRMILIIMLLLGAAFAQDPCGDNQCLCGDCDGDGVVTIIDALQAARTGAGLHSLTDPYFNCCNVQGTPGGMTTPGTDVTVLDALVIAQVSAGYRHGMACAEDPLLAIPGYRDDFGHDQLMVFNTVTMRRCATIDLSTIGAPSWVSAERVEHDDGNIFLVGRDRYLNNEYLVKVDDSSWAITSHITEPLYTLFDSTLDTVNDRIYISGYQEFNIYDYDLNPIASIPTSSLASVEFYRGEAFFGYRDVGQIDKYHGTTMTGSLSIPSAHSFLMDIEFSGDYLFVGSATSQVAKFHRVNMVTGVVDDLSFASTGTAVLGTYTMWIDIDHHRQLAFASWLELTATPGDPWVPHISVIDISGPPQLVAFIDPPFPSSLIGGVSYDSNMQRLIVTRNVDQPFVVVVRLLLIWYILDVSQISGYNLIHTEQVAVAGYSRDVGLIKG